MEQKVEEESIDIVYGVNASHVALDLLKSLRHIYSILRPGGSIIICEVARGRRVIAVYQEIIFTLLDSYNNIELNPEYRSSFGFLTIDEWQ